ncbi:diacylglycerol/lipid kinase family protein [Ramlibacter rhizophilus]|uniref:diacylglycerol/lipid kinase family protein n=1 Tax=Ramlibacter rhizophilus TaxID=1781167 RepID=UPI001F0FAB38|nr:diacylglycerol kinase family protein [Ramlibacter rhizophilus]
MPRFLVLLNPASGGGREVAQHKREILERVFREAGQDHEFVPLDSPAELAHVARLAAERAHREDAVLVAVGGDGTLTTAAQAAHHAGCVLGAVPQGTFNYFGREQGLSQDAEQAARALLRATPRPVQVGTINGRLFLVNASLGLYPQLLDDREAFVDRFGRHRWVALLSALSTLFKWRHQLSVQIEVDGRERRLRTPTLFICNNRVQLARLGLAPEVLEQVGRTHMVAMVLKPIGTVAMFGLLLRGAFGRLGEAEQVESFTFDRLTVSVRSARRVKVAADGEIGMMTQPITFEVCPTPLMLMMPSDEDRVEAE